MLKLLMLENTKETLFFDEIRELFLNPLTDSGVLATRVIQRKPNILLILD